MYGVLPMRNRFVRKRKWLWDFLNERGPMTVSQIQDARRHERLGNYTSRQMSMFFKRDVLFEKGGKCQQKYFSGSTGEAVLWGARSVDDLIIYFTEKPHNAPRIERLPKHIKDAVKRGMDNEIET